MRPELALLLLAHDGEHHELLHAWTFDPLVLGALAISATAYGLGLARLWRKAGASRGLPAWRAGAFAAAWATVLIALISPVDALSDVFFSAHMAQHELLMVVAAPLFVLGKPTIPLSWVLPERIIAWFRKPAPRATWRLATNPFLVLVLHAVVRWVWHLPALFEAALEDERIHSFQHLGFFVTALLFWWSLIHGRYGRTGYGVAVLYTFVTATHTGALAALLTFARRAWYPLYAARSPGTNALEDQQLAGLIMWVPSGVIFMTIGLALFAAWMGAIERRASRLADAHDAQPPAPLEDVGG